MKRLCTQVRKEFNRMKNYWLLIFFSVTCFIRTNFHRNVMTSPVSSVLTTFLTSTLKSQESFALCSYRWTRTVRIFLGREPSSSSSRTRWFILLEVTEGHRVLLEVSESKTWWGNLRINQPGDHKGCSDLRGTLFRIQKWVEIYTPRRGRELSTGSKLKVEFVSQFPKFELVLDTDLTWFFVGKDISRSTIYWIQNNRYVRDSVYELDGIWCICLLLPVQNCLKILVS